MDSRRLPLVLVACALIAACQCNDRAPKRAAQASSLGEGEGARPMLPPPEGTPLDPETLQPFVPDSVAGFTAQGSPQPRVTPLPNGGQLPGIRRQYEREGVKLQIDITDTLHVGTLRELVLSQQGVERKNERTEFRGAPIAGYPALQQWHAPTKVGVVNMVVGDRFITNVKVSDGDSLAPAQAAIEALPLDALAKLAEQPDPADEAQPGATTKRDAGQAAGPAKRELRGAAPERRDRPAATAPSPTPP